MQESTPAVVSREIKTQLEFDQIVMELFGSLTSVEEFIEKFDEYFPKEVGYQNDLSKKLKPRVCLVEHKVSCSGASLMLESFVRQKLPGKYKVFLLNDNLTSKGHTVAFLVPPDLPLPDDPTKIHEWILSTIKTDQHAGMKAFHYKKSTNFVPYNLQSSEKLERYAHVFDSPTKYIKNRHTAFMNAQAADV